MTTQRCPRCSRDLSLDAYIPAHRGTQGHYCKECRRDYNRRYRQDRRLAAMDVGSSPVEAVRCAVEECSIRLRGDRTHCARHQLRLEKYGDPLGTPPKRQPQSAEDKREYNRRWRRENPEKYQGQKRRYRKRYPERERDRRRQYYARNGDQLREASRQWALANPSKRRANFVDWKARNSDRYQAWLEANREYLAAQRAEWTSARQTATTQKASHVRTPWSAAEITVALDPEMSATEAAFALGRSLRAVYRARSRYLGTAA